MVLHFHKFYEVTILNTHTCLAYKLVLPVFSKLHLSPKSSTTAVGVLSGQCSMLLMLPARASVHLAEVGLALPKPQSGAANTPECPPH